MKTINEIKQWLLKNAVNEDGDLVLSDLDLSDFEGNVYIHGWKVKHSLDQSEQQVGGNLIQNYQVVDGDIYQNYQVVDGGIHQDHQIADGDIYQDRQIADDIIQDK